MKDVVLVIAFVIAVMGFGSWMTGRKWLYRETERNEGSKPPSSRQLRWDIRHMREDLHMIILSNYALVLLVLFMVFYVLLKS
jgi:hypothetical protein